MYVVTFKLKAKFTHGVEENLLCTTLRNQSKCSSQKSNMDLDRRTYFPKPCCYHTKYIIIRKNVANITYFQNPSRQEVTPNRLALSWTFIKSFFLATFWLFFIVYFSTMVFIKIYLINHSIIIRKFVANIYPPGHRLLTTYMNSIQIGSCRTWIVHGGKKECCPVITHVMWFLFSKIIIHKYLISCLCQDFSLWRKV